MILFLSLDKYFTMKIKLLKFSPTVILLLYTLNLSAAVITWTGGTGNWDVSANWDSATIPTTDDDVMISSGIVTIPASYSAQAHSVTISSTGVLELAGSSVLQIDSAAVNGIVINSGSGLNNAGVIHLNSPVIFGIEIYSGAFHNLATGEVYITNEGTGGIRNHKVGATLTNDGLIRINHTGLGDGIYSTKFMVNNADASIIIKNTKTNGIDSYNGSLTNHGEIKIDSTGADGMLITGNGFTNSGHVEISHCYEGGGANGAMGIYAKSIKNKPGGSFYIHHVESSAMRAYGDIENQGLIEIYDNYYIGIFVKDGTLSNQESGKIRCIGNGNSGIHLDNASVENGGLLFFNNNAGWAIDAGNGSDTDNKTNGTVEGNGVVRGGDFVDSGTLIPGDNIGGLEIYGYQPALPTYYMDIAGSGDAGSPGGYDVLIFRFPNTDTLQGNVYVAFADGYTGVSKDTFDMISVPLGYTGTFNSINLPVLGAGLFWETVYAVDGVKFIIDGTITWTGTISEDWNTAGNWDRNIVPTEINDVIIPNGTTYSAHINSEPIIRSLLVMPGATMVIAQALTVKP